LVVLKKQAELQSLQDPSEVKEDNLSNVRRKLVGISGTRKSEYLKDKIKSLNQTVRIRISENCIGA
jgi:hypothetical protein